jgi:hypothetical protein
MRCRSLVIFVSMIFWFGGCGDESLSTRAGGAGGTLAAGGAVGTGGTLAAGGAVGTGGSAVGTGGALATGGAVGTGGSAAGTGGALVTTGTAGMDAGAVATGGTLATGGAAGTGGAPFSDAGDEDGPLATGGWVGTGGAVSNDAGGGEGPLPSGGVGGTGDAQAAGGVVGPVDARDTSADRGGDSASGGKSALDLVPVNNLVSGWTVDQAHNRDGSAQPMTATTFEEVVGLIDGAAEGFFTPPYTPNQFAWQNYVNSTLPSAPDGAYLSLYVFRMPSAEQAAGLYQALLQQAEYSRKVGTPDDWQPTSPTIGAESRIQDTGTSWWINFHQDVFYVEIRLDPSSGPPPDYVLGNPVTEAEALRFARAVASRI